MRRICGVVIVFGIILALIALVIRHRSANPEAAFEKLIMAPIPGSVRSIEQGHVVGMDGGFWALRFFINNADLQNILSAGHYLQVNADDEFRRAYPDSQGDANSLRNQYFKQWNLKIEKTTMIKVDLTSNWLVYTVLDAGHKKYIFSETNTSETVFVGYDY
jgi:hypothetical protein